MTATTATTPGAGAATPTIAGPATARPARDPRLVLNRDVLDSLWIATLLTVGSYALAFALGWTHALNPVEAFAVFTSYSCTWLCIQQRRFNYVMGASSTAAYCLLFWQQSLYASMVLNAYLTPALLYGWIRWRADADTRPVMRVALRWVPLYVVVAGAGYLGAVALTTNFGGSFAPADSLILVGSILAQFLLDNKKVETWLVWCGVNVVAIWLYTTSGLAIAGLQYVLFLVTAVIGFRRWWLTMRSQSVP